MIRQKVTLELIYEVVDERTQDLKECLNQMNRRFEAMDRRFDSMDHRFDALNARIDQLFTLITNQRQS